MSPLAGRLLGITLLAASVLSAPWSPSLQVANGSETVPPPAQEAADTSGISGAERDTVEEDSVVTGPVRTRGAISTRVVDREQNWPQPTVTLVKSMVVPGWGQLTNRRYLKAAAIIGLETWFILGAISEWRKADDALADFRQTNDINDFFEYDFHNGNRNDYLWSLGVTVFISMFDAYVDAHLRPYGEDRIPQVDPPPGVAMVVWSF